MSKSKYKIIENGQPHFLTCTVVDWIPIFEMDEFKNVIIDSLKFLVSNNRIVLYAYCVMNHHIHITASSKDLKREMASFKSFTARVCLDKLEEYGMDKLRDKFKVSNPDDNRTHQFWIEGYHPELIQGIEMMKQKVNYIHENPVRAGYVEKAEDWIYSSVFNYIGKSGIIDVKTEWFE